MKQYRDVTRFFFLLLSLSSFIRVISFIKKASFIRMGLSSQITTELHRQNSNKNDVTRVIKCWEDFSIGKKVKQSLYGNSEIEQEASCYVEGLTAIPFHDIKTNKKLNWALQLETKADEIAKEVT